MNEKELSILWREEINRGHEAGKLIRANGRADLKTVHLTLDDHEFLVEKYHKRAAV